MAKILSTQEAFDLALNGVRAQGYAPSITVLGDCAYRGDRGLKCSVGHCIPNSMYRKALEHQNAEVIWDYPDLALRFSRVSKDFLVELQDIHDAIPGEASLSKRKTFFEMPMQNLAAAQKLTYSPP